MSELDKPRDESPAEKKDWQIAVKWLNTSGFRILIAIAVVLTVAVVVLAIVAKDANILSVGILTVLTIVVTTISAVSNRLMVEIMDRQETESTKQRIAAEATVKLNDKMVANMQGQLGVLKDGYIETRNLLKQNQKMIRASNRQAEAAENSVEVARGALEQAKESLIISERAHIGIGPITVEGGKLIGGVPTVYSFDLINGGKTPAFDVWATTRDFTSAQFSVELATELEKSPEVRKQRPPIICKYLLAGSVEPFDPIRGNTTDITDGHMGEVIAGNETLYLFVMVSFQDFQRNRHWELYRFYYNIDTKTFLPYEEDTVAKQE